MACEAAQGGGNCIRENDTFLSLNGETMETRRGEIKIMLRERVKASLSAVLLGNGVKTRTGECCHDNATKGEKGERCAGRVEKGENERGRGEHSEGSAA